MTFFSYLRSAKSMNDMPSPLYDLLQDDAAVHQRRVHVRREALQKGVIYYILRPILGASHTFELGLTSAASVVEILRNQWGPELSDIARELLARGIEFQTFVQGDPRPRTPERLVPRFSGLGYRPPQYKPDHIDYAAYERRRDRLLSSRGRAALLMGGIVARLAREAVSFDDVCNGPSDRVFWDGTVLFNERSPSSGYWDDSLTPDELDIICGVYKVATGE